MDHSPLPVTHAWHITRNTTNCEAAGDPRGVELLVMSCDSVVHL